MKRKICGLYLRLKMLILSISKSGGFHIGDNVYDPLNDRKATIIDMSRYTGDVPPLQLLHVIYNKNEMYYMLERDAKKCKDFHTIKNSLLYYYRWWRAAWYEIKLDEMLNKR